MARAEASLEPDNVGASHGARSRTEALMELFRTRLREQGLKSTSPRDDIAHVFFDLGRHVSAEELYAEVKRVNPHVGYATIYRTLKLMKDCGLLSERHFDEGQARYEVIGDHHHDQFICESCSKIIEFEDDALERLQRNVARKLGVTLHRHKLELYGRCADCRKKAAAIDQP